MAADFPVHVNVMEPIVRWRGARGDQFLLAPVLCIAAGCAGPLSLPDLSAPAGYTRETLESGGFRLAALRRGSPAPGTLLTIYIEGDGHAFRHRNRPAADPTPKRAPGLELALQDPGANVMYLARPCQFQTRPLPPNCTPALWTTARYSEAVVAAMNSAIHQAAQGFDRVALVGYSGGGTVAALIAARRSDVAWLVTVAANLDHVRWTARHGVTPLAGSLNAADVARAVQHLPQVHFVGGRDDIVPVEIVNSFMAPMDETSRVSVRIEPGFDHECCWVEAWPRLLEEARALLQK